MDEHAAEVKARLDAGEHLTVHDGPRTPSDPVREPPFVTFYVHIPDEDETKLNRTTTDRTWVTVTTHSIGATLSDSRLVRKRVRAQLLDWVPVVAGWDCKKVGHDGGDPEDWDTSTGDLTYDAVDYWTYRCEPIG